MGVTKRQVERLAKAVVAYDEARTAVMGQKATRLHHTEPVTDVDDLEAIAKAAGEKVRTREISRFVTSYVEAYGVEFFHIEKKEGGDA